MDKVKTPSTEGEVLDCLDLVFEWHKVPGEIAFDMWLCQQLTVERNASKGLRAALVELNDAMHRYQSDSEGEQPPKHIAMMRRVADTLLATERQT